MTKSTKSEEVVVFGGCVLDISASPASGTKLVPGTSNIGAVRQSAGGVGRNVAEVMRRLGTHVQLCTSIGADPAGHALWGNLRASGLGTALVSMPAIHIVPDDPGQGATLDPRNNREGAAHAGTGRAAPPPSSARAAPQRQRLHPHLAPQHSQEIHSAVYAALYDHRGELVTAVADMSIFETMDPARTLDAEAWASTFGRARAVVCDGNPAPGALAAIARRLVASSHGARGAAASTQHRKIWFEPTSVAKAVRCADRDVLAATVCVKPNAAEAAAIAGALLETETETERPRPTSMPSPARASRPAYTLSDLRAASKEGVPPSLAASVPSEVFRILSEGLWRDICVILATGVPHVVVTLGRGGALVASRGDAHARSPYRASGAPEGVRPRQTVAPPSSARVAAGTDAAFDLVVVHVPAVENCTVVNVNGAGDTAMGALVHAHVTMGWGIETSAAFAMHTAAITLGDKGAVGHSISESTVLSFAGKDHAGRQPPRSRL